jgi:aspartate carbamoyltransferase catalytic subunit
MGQNQLTDLPRHIIDVKSLGKAGIELVLDSIGVEQEKMQSSVALLFFENSTRTRLSFELAALQLGYPVLNPNLQTSSLQKGETALDTVITLAAMGVDQLVIRSSEEGFPEKAVQAVGDHCRIINAGDGTHQHPTQALTDLYILKKQCRNEWADLHVGIVGNISHSRVANSLIDGFSLMGVGSLNLIGPEAWLPSTIPSFAQCYTDLCAGVQNINALVILRAQSERMADLTQAEVHALQRQFRVTESHLPSMKKNAIIMHPGPVMRNEEIDANLLHHPCVKINDQVTAGVAVRKALLSLRSKSALKK